MVVATRKYQVPRRPWGATWVLFLLSTVVWLAGPATAEDRPKVVVSAAASLREVMKDLAVVYQRQTGIDVEVNLGASGALAAQIDAGAPVDVFISAADRPVDDLVKKGRVDPASRRVIARNSVVLIVKEGANSGQAVKSFKSLGEDAVKHVAIGQPKSVPAGEYAVQVLENAGVWDRVKAKAVYGANVRQVLDYVAQGEVDAGVVYATDAREAGDKVAVVQVAAEDSHKPVVYPAVVVKGGHEAAARGFVDFLTGDIGKAEFEKRGFAAAAKEQKGEGGGGRG